MCAFIDTRSVVVALTLVLAACAGVTTFDVAPCYARGGGSGGGGGDGGSEYGASYHDPKPSPAAVRDMQDAETEDDCDGCLELADPGLQQPEPDDWDSDDSGCDGCLEFADPTLANEPVDEESNDSGCDGCLELANPNLIPIWWIETPSPGGPVIIPTEPIVPERAETPVVETDPTEAVVLTEDKRDCRLPHLQSEAVKTTEEECARLREDLTKLIVEFQNASPTQQQALVTWIRAQVRQAMR